MIDNEWSNYYIDIFRVTRGTDIKHLTNLDIYSFMLNKRGGGGQIKTAKVPIRLFFSF